MGFIFDSEGNAYFTHPTYIQYASDHYGNVVDIRESVYLDGDEFGFIYIESKDSLTVWINSFGNVLTILYRNMV